MQGVATVAAVSLEIGYPTMASAPHSIVNGMKNLLAIAAVTDITFKVSHESSHFLGISANHLIVFEGKSYLTVCGLGKCTGKNNNMVP
jgi:hypothetical protein